MVGGVNAELARRICGQSAVNAVIYYGVRCKVASNEYGDVWVIVQPNGYWTAQRSPANEPP